MGEVSREEGGDMKEEWERGGRKEEMREVGGRNKFYLQV